MSIHDDATRAPFGSGGPNDAAEASQRDGEARLRALFDHAPIGIFTTDSRGRALSVNSTMARLLGLGSAEEAVATYRDLAGQLYVDPARRADFLAELRANGRVEGFEYQARTADGRLVWLSMNARVIQRVGDDLVIEGFSSDVTDRVRAVEALRTSERRFRALIENAPDGIVLVHPERGMLFASPAARRMFGFGPDDSVEAVSPDQSTHPDDLPSVLAALQELLADPAKVVTLRYRFRPRDGGWLWIESRFSNLLAVEGVEAIVINFRNVDEEMRAQALHEKLHAQLDEAQKLESLGRLAGGVAHDFNNLLMGIQNYVELCRDDLSPGHPALAWLDGIADAGQRSAEIVRQLLAFARRQPISPTVLDLNDAVGGMLKLIRRMIGEGVDLRWCPGANLWPVRLDPSQVDQVLANLCVNARDAMAGTGTITIATANVACAANDEGEARHDFVQLSVTDDGCGMTDDVRAHIFDPFFTTKEVGKGTGLGLSTVYGIVQQNGGRIEVHSAPGQGATFRILLPRLTDGVSAAEPDVPEAVPRARGETVLVVEDETAVRTTCARVLESLGYRVLVAPDPARALALCAGYAGPLDLLLTDVVLPGMEGTRLAEKLQAARPGLRCLFMSGYGGDVIAPSGLLQRDLAFLPKPFSRARLARKLRELLDPKPTAAG